MHARFFLILVMGLGFAGAWNSRAAAPVSLDATLAPIRAKFGLPALAGAIFTADGVVATGVVGVRKAGTNIPATGDDLWHLGSDTKMMTATLAGTFVAEGKLSWDAKILSFFPGIAARAPASLQNVTFGQVLGHQAGLKENLDWVKLALGPGTLVEKRRAAAGEALLAPAYPPGTFHYSNTDYVVAGAVLEKIGGQPWEQLMRERIFGPLKMTSAGFGGTGTPGQVDQPWPHLDGAVPVFTNGPAADNPAIMAPAGTVHCTVADWARFLIDQLRGGTGQKALLPANIYTAMQTAGPNSEYGYGWGVTKRGWAGGKALSHAGSNTMNFAVCWLAPAKGFGVLVCTNEGGDTAAKGCDAASGALIRFYQAGLKP